MGHGHDQVMLDMVLDPVGRDEQPRQPAGTDRPGLPHRVGWVRDDGVLRDGTDSGHQFVGREPRARPEKIEERLTDGPEQAEEQQVRRQSANNHPNRRPTL